MTINEAPVGVVCTLTCGCRVKSLGTTYLAEWWCPVEVMASCSFNYVSCAIFGGSKKSWGVPSQPVVPSYREVSIDPLSLELIEE